MRKISKISKIEVAKTVDIEKKTPIKKIKKVEAASYCCEAAETVDIEKLIRE